jgi:cell division protein YceG involved in septum cleavage
MSSRTREINRITTAIISISVKLMVYALIVLLLYEAVVRGFAFGHSVFYAEAVEEAPGRDISVTLPGDETISETAELLSEKGLIKSSIAFLFQSKFYDYDTIYPGTYTLNTSMTSKEILQVLSQKPEEESEGASKAASSKAAAGKTAETAAAQTAAGETKAPETSADAKAGAKSTEHAETSAGTEQTAAETSADTASETAAETQTSSEETLPAEQSSNPWESYAEDDTVYGGEEEEEGEGGWIEEIPEETPQ